MSLLLNAISEVPAPTSIKARFNNLKFRGTAASMAAIGSKVKFITLRPTFSITEYKLSITDLGRKVAITSADILFPL